MISEKELEEKSKRYARGVVAALWDVKRSDAMDSSQAEGVIEAAHYNGFQSGVVWQKQRRTTRIVCLCGSTRFIEQIACMAWELEKKGAIVLGMHLLPANYGGVQADHQAEAEGVAARMDELHKRKIDLADEILVMNVGGYIGSSTRSEIEYAEKHGKVVRYLEAPAS